MFGEGFGAIAALQQEGLAARHLAQRALQLARLAGKNERRKAGELALDLGERGRVRIDRRLLDGFARQLSSGIRSPALNGHHSNSDAS